MQPSLDCPWADVELSLQHPNRVSQLDSSNRLFSFDEQKFIKKTEKKLFFFDV